MGSLADSPCSRNADDKDERSGPVCHPCSQRAHDRNVLPRCAQLKSDRPVARKRKSVGGNRPLMGLSPLGMEHAWSEQDQWRFVRRPGIIPHSAEVVEWQTRTFEGRVAKAVRVQVPPSAPYQACLRRHFFIVVS